MNIDRIVNKILNEITNTHSRGGYDYPLKNKIRKFKKTSLDPFNFEVNLGDDPKEEIKKNKLNEDLAVWFGKKKKKKGSKQPKGPWVNICRKVDGKHPPCGRKSAKKGSYPKCRGAHAAGKMSPGEKRRACRQKRAVERKDTQRGKGQKPNWVSHKKRKKKTNENMKTRIVNLNENDLMRIVKRVINEQKTNPPRNKKLNLFCKSNRNNDSFYKNNLKYNQASKKPSGVTEIILDIETYVPDGVLVGEDDQNFVLNVTPVSLLGNKYSDELDIINPNNNIVLMNYNSSRVAYFCQIDFGTDQEWADYFNTF